MRTSGKLLLDRAVLHQKLPRRDLHLAAVLSFYPDPDLSGKIATEVEADPPICQFFSSFRLHSAQMRKGGCFASFCSPRTSCQRRPFLQARDRPVTAAVFQKGKRDAPSGIPASQKMSGKAYLNNTPSFHPAVPGAGRLHAPGIPENMEKILNRSAFLSS